MAPALAAEPGGRSQREEPGGTAMVTVGPLRHTRFVPKMAAIDHDALDALLRKQQFVVSRA